MKLTSPVVLLVLLAVAGCGGGSDGSFTEDYNTAVKPLSEPEHQHGDQRGAVRQARRANGRRRATTWPTSIRPSDAKDEMDKLLSGARTA